MTLAAPPLGRDYGLASKTGRNHAEPPTHCATVRCGHGKSRLLSQFEARFAPPVGRGGPQRLPRPPEARSGPPAPWSGMDAARLNPTKSDLVAAVEAYTPLSPEAVAVDGRQPSAVLVLLAGSEAAPEIVFTRRAWHMRSHTGEVSFPGGRFEDGDADLEATALRESFEEIALDSTGIQVVGQLDRMATVSSPALIVPYVAQMVVDQELVPAPEEVDAVLRVPVSELLDPSIYRSEIWQRFDDTELEITFFELVGDTLWGATARMVRNLFEIALDV